MRAVVWKAIGDISVDDVADPRIEQPTDAVIRVTTSAICGTDLHLIRGTLPGMRPGQVLGHEAVGEVVAVGSEVRNFSPGDRVVVGSTIACGYCSYCRAGYESQCDNANPAGPRAGTAYYGGPESAGGYAGLQAEYARIPYASANLVSLPDDLGDDQAIMLSDIFPTAWFGTELAEVRHGDTVAVFGCGPVGQLAVLSARLRGAGRVIAVDRTEDRLAFAKRMHAETVNFDAEDPVQAIAELTGGIGVDRAVDAVGVDAKGPGGGGTGNQALRWAVQALAKAGSLGIIGVHPPTMESFPLGLAMNKNLTIKAGNCNHRRYIPELIALARGATVEPATVLTETVPMDRVVEAYERFERQEPGWIKVALAPQN
jgi:threonine dehydrogenase-like Zn-dependent dehydrogenase